MSTARILVLIAVCFSVTGELLLKSGMNRVGVLSLQNFGPMLQRMIGTWQLYVGLGSIATGAVFWLGAISRADLSWAYPMLATGYILVLAFSTLVLREPLSAARIIGTLLIALGAVLVTRS